MGGDAATLREVEAFLARMRRRGQIYLVLLFTLPTLFIAGAFTWEMHGDGVRRWTRGEVDLGGRRVFTPPHPDAPRPNTEAVRWLHVEALPAWVIALNLSPRAADHQMERIFGRLKDPNMLHLLGELRLLARQNMVAHAQRIFYLVWAWNGYLDSHGLPWRLDASIRARPRRMLLMRTYRTVHDLRVAVGSESHRSRLLLRVDQTNIVDSYFGFTEAGGQGSFVLLDSIHSFVSDHVWPLTKAAPALCTGTSSNGALLLIYAGRPEHSWTRSTTPPSAGKPGPDPP